MKVWERRRAMQNPTDLTNSIIGSSSTCECSFLHLDFASVAELKLQRPRHFEKKRNFHASHQLFPQRPIAFSLPHTRNHSPTGRNLSCPTHICVVRRAARRNPAIS